jgi:hypothetical protein
VEQGVSIFPIHPCEIWSQEAKSDQFIGVNIMVNMPLFSLAFYHPGGDSDFATIHSRLIDVDSVSTSRD